MRSTNVKTLVDALVGGLVVSALVALVSPVLGAARLSPEAKTCLDNERRIGLALVRYTEDYDGYFPKNRPSAGINWKDAVRPYLGIPLPVDEAGKKLFRCPTNPAGDRLDETGRWPRSYAYNGAILYGKFVASNGLTEAFRASDVKNPSAFMLLMETRNYQSDLGPWMIDGNAAPDGTWSNPRVIWQDEQVGTHGVFHHHDLRMNVALVDGHTISVTLPQTVAVPQMWNPWQPPDAYTAKINGMLPEYK